MIVINIDWRLIPIVYIIIYILFLIGLIRYRNEIEFHERNMVTFILLYVLFFISVILLLL